MAYIVFTSAVCGGTFYRMRGGAPDWPRPLEQMLFCSVFFVLAAIMVVPLWANALAFSIATLAALTGHGQYFLEMVVKAIAPEKLDFIVKAIMGRDPRCHDI